MFLVLASCHNFNGYVISQLGLDMLEITQGRCELRRNHNTVICSSKSQVSAARNFMSSTYTSLKSWIWVTAIRMLCILKIFHYLIYACFKQLTKEYGHIICWSRRDWNFCMAQLNCVWNVMVFGEIVWNMSAAASCVLLLALILF